jgi:hypothetical protein
VSYRFDDVEELIGDYDLVACQLGSVEVKRGGVAGVPSSTTSTKVWRLGLCTWPSVRRRRPCGSA